MKKKIVPKTAKKAVRKNTSKKVTKPMGKPVRPAQGKPIGVVTHFYNKIKVGIVKFNKPVKVGTRVAFRGASTDFTQELGSMQLDHEAITVAKKGKQIGLKVSKRVREGDQVFLAE